MMNTDGLERADGGMPTGSYALLLTLDEELVVPVGSLGERVFPAGHYVYVGTAFGPGGLSRVDRHRRVAEGTNGTRHWHIDYLLPHTTIAAVYTAENTRHECRVAEALPGRRIDGFGASDCTCPGHLVFGTDAAALRESLQAWYGAPGRSPTSAEPR